MKKGIEKITEFGIMVNTARIREYKNDKGEYKKTIEGRDISKEKNFSKKIILDKESNHNCLIVCTGKKNCPQPVFVIDIDNKSDSSSYKNGMNKWKELLEEHGEIDTSIAETPNGGLHYYFNYHEKLSKFKSGTSI